MIVHKLRNSDSLENLSAFYAIPVCMIMRANGLTEATTPIKTETLKIPDRQYCARLFENKPEPPLLPALLEYRVLEGDTLYEIARRYRTTMHILVRLNRIEDATLLPAGQTIKIPLPPPGCIRYYVKPSDTLESICARCRVPGKCIRAYNFLNENDNVFPGMQLLIP